MLLVGSAQLAGGRDSDRADSAAMPGSSGEEVQFWRDTPGQGGAQVEPRPLLDTKRLALALLAALAGD